MSLKVVYVEDETGPTSPATKLSEEIKEYNKGNQDPILLSVAISPEELPAALANSCDLVLADVYFQTPEDPAGINRLGDIISIVQRWSESENLGRSIPIIAYTGRGRGALDECLKKRADLYDIWDKASASPPYAAWRLGKLASEISRIRPDSLMQRLISQMANGANWHEHVRNMARRYDSGWTERDQIHGAGIAIEHILKEMDVWEECNPLWEAMTEWEAIGRAVSRRTRGHARHVINVFWLGYYLIHHPLMRKTVEMTWKQSLKRLGKGKVARGFSATQALSNCWLFAGLFHDMCSAVEKYPQVQKRASDIVQKFHVVVEPASKRSPISRSGNWTSSDLPGLANTLLSSYSDELQAKVLPIWKETLKENAPDHGVLGGVQLSSAVVKTTQAPYALEAARAIALHNIVGKMDDSHGRPLRWEDEGLACLLVVCDQIQTWDRERDDKALKDEDDPERAELIALDIREDDGRVYLDISINYVGPRHIEYVPEIQQRIEDALGHILIDKPNRAMKRIAEPWPFHIRLKCYLNRRKMPVEISF